MSSETDTTSKAAALLFAGLLAGSIGAIGSMAAAETEPDGGEADAPDATTADTGVSSDTDAGDTADTAPAIPPEKLAAGREAFVQVTRVLKSPRCMNCHPTGDRPLQTDESVPHAMNVSRTSVEGGMTCATCHRDRNSEAYGVEGGPPGAPHWGLPPEDTPMIFQGRTAAELCRQLKDPARNGGKDMQALLEHVTADPLVLWGWKPGGDRTKPPLSHEEFVAAFETWVESGGACPE